MLLETAPFGLADSRSAGDRRLSVRFRAFCAHLMLRKLWDLSKVHLNRNMPEVPEAQTALNADSDLLIESYTLHCCEIRGTSAQQEMCYTFISRNPWPDCDKMGPDVTGVTRWWEEKEQWEDSVKMDRQLGREKPDHLGNLEHSIFSDTLQRDCAHGKRSPENLRLELDEKAIPALEAHAML